MKLSEDQRREVARRARAGEPVHALASEFKISMDYVRHLESDESMRVFDFSAGPRQACQFPGAECARHPYVWRSDDRRRVPERLYVCKAHEATPLPPLAEISTSDLEERVREAVSREPGAWTVPHLAKELNVSGLEVARAREARGLRISGGRLYPEGETMGMREQILAVFALSGDDGISVREVANRLNITPQAVSYYLPGLKDTGLVEQIGTHKKTKYRLAVAPRTAKAALLQKIDAAVTRLRADLHLVAAEVEALLEQETSS